MKYKHPLYAFFLDDQRVIRVDAKLSSVLPKESPIAVLLA